jgi:RimJ/RimL family protein N-acetyltransferase
MGYKINPISTEDTEKIRVWRNSQMDVLRQGKEISVDDQILYYKDNVWNEFSAPNPKNILFGIHNEGELIGYGGLVHIAWEHSRAEISFLVNPKRIGIKSIYEEDFSSFLHMIKQVAFENLYLSKLFTETYATRLHHISILEKNGLTLEGILRHHVLIDDTFIDSLMHGILRSEYEK